MRFDFLLYESVYSDKHFLLANLHRLTVLNESLWTFHRVAVSQSESFPVSLAMNLDVKVPRALIGVLCETIRGLTIRKVHVCGALDPPHGLNKEASWCYSDYSEWSWTQDGH